MRNAPDAVFTIPKPSLLADAINIIDGLPIDDRTLDTQGDLYEELLSELNLAGKNGQFRTTRHIIRTIVELVNPQLGEWLCDPAAGTAGFLVGSFQWILKTYTPEADITIDPDGSWHNLTAKLLGRRQKDRRLLDGERFIGYDFDTTMVRLGLMNMMLHGITKPQFFYQDTLSASFQPSRKFDVILANPPFTGNLDRQDINTNLLSLGTTKTELLFVDLCLALLKPGGRCAVIVPEGVLFASSKAHRELRRRLIDQNQLNAIISLPAGCFKPYTGVKTAILLLRRGGTTNSVWFYEATGDGYSLDDRRAPQPETNDLQFAPQAYRILVEGSSENWASETAQLTAERQTWRVHREGISRENFSLSASIYRPTQLETAVHEDYLSILQRTQTLEDQIQDSLQKIVAMIGGVLNE